MCTLLSVSRRHLLLILDSRCRKIHDRCAMDVAHQGHDFRSNHEQQEIQSQNLSQCCSKPTEEGLFECSIWYIRIFWLNWLIVYLQCISLLSMQIKICENYQMFCISEVFNVSPGTSENMSKASLDMFWEVSEVLCALPKFFALHIR